MIVELSSGAEIHLESIPNAHEVYLGKSGSGKTWAICRRMEELCNEKKVCVIDWSGSFSLKELEKAGLCIEQGVQVIDLKGQRISLPVMRGDGYDADRIVSLAENALGITGSLQKAILQEIASEVCLSEQPSLKKIVTRLEKEEAKEEAVENNERARRIEKILDRLSRFVKLEAFDFWASEKMVPDTQKLVIIQLSNLTPSCRKICVAAVLWAIWELIEQGNVLFDRIVLDEAQHVDFSADIPSQMVREGRKYGLGIIMSTQFLKGLNEDTISTIEQSENIFFFRPELKSVSAIARMIEPARAGKWASVLRNLKVGQAVLVGTYRVNRNKKSKTKNIVVYHKKAENRGGRDNDVG